jgi:hypothetical protein
MAQHTTDESILGRISSLVQEDQRLYGHRDLADHDQARLKNIRVELDQCWDLLRQRDAKREFGDNPDTAAVRPAVVVER